MSISNARQLLSTAMDEAATLMLLYTYDRNLQAQQLEILLQIAGDVSMDLSLGDDVIHQIRQDLAASTEKVFPHVDDAVLRRAQRHPNRLRVQYDELP